MTASLFEQKVQIRSRVRGFSGALISQQLLEDLNSTSLPLPNTVSIKLKDFRIWISKLTTQPKQILQFLSERVVVKGQYPAFLESLGQQLRIDTNMSPKLRLTLHRRIYGL
jgi:hypothetical protein